ncbi:MAG: hypothetical protein AB7F19_00140 [Candidatus Babeliales bacterium]
MKKTLCCLLMLVSLIETTSLGMMPLSQQELTEIAQACDAHPYVCYAFLGAQAVCYTVLAGLAVKDYCCPRMPSFLSCCTGLKKKVTGLVAQQQAVTAQAPLKNPGKERLLALVAAKHEKLP